METLYRNARIWTGNPSGLDAGPESVELNALLVVDGRIAWMGDKDALGRDVSAARRDHSADGRDVSAAGWHPADAEGVVDLDGALVVPGFVDAHAHLSMTGLTQRGADLGTTASLRHALDAIESHARRSQGRPIYAPNWQEANWPERRPMTNIELDRAAYGGVVYAPRIDVHSAVISSALAAASGAATLDGWLGNGLVTRAAHHAARAAFFAGITPAQRRGDIEAALRAAAATGITHIHECGGPDLSSADDFADVLALGRRPDLPATIGYWAQLVTTADEARDVRADSGAHALGGDLNIDGSLGSRTAHLRTPYADHPGRGNAYLTSEQVAAHVAACARAGIQSGFHVIGDAGLDIAIAGIADAARRCGLDTIRAARVRLEHAEMADREAIAQLARLGVHTSVQPAFDAAWGGPAGMYAERLGRDRASGLNPLRTMSLAGVPIAFGSDSPVTAFDPWGSIRAASAHHEPAQRLSVAAGLTAHSWGGHCAAGDDAGGVLRVGAAATFTAWTVNDAGPDGLPRFDGTNDPACQLTVRDGHTLFAR